MGKLKDFTDIRYGKLVAVARVGGKLWRFKCDCGGERVEVPARLACVIRRELTPHCGCSDQRGNSRTHGMSRSAIHVAWVNMKQRCGNPNRVDYKHYGARGIGVCERWLCDFDAFYADMAPSYAEGMTLDRVDNSKGYSPENCRWATRSEQCRNQRTNRMVHTLDGAVTMAEAAVAFGLKYDTLRCRLNSGWSVHAALSTPVRSRPV